LPREEVSRKASSADIRGLASSLMSKDELIGNIVQVIAENLWLKADSTSMACLQTAIRSRTSPNEFGELML
jgi:hypothetical protein